MGEAGQQTLSYYLSVLKIHSSHRLEVHELQRDKLSGPNGKKLKTAFIILGLRSLLSALTPHVPNQLQGPETLLSRTRPSLHT